MIAIQYVIGVASEAGIIKLGCVHKAFGVTRFHECQQEINKMDSFVPCRDCYRFCSTRHGNG